MKTLLLPLATFSIASLFAQTPAGIYASITKSDGSTIKGTSVTYRYEDLFVVKSLSGGADNTATVELEVPTSGYTATFRNLVDTAPVKAKTTPANQVAAGMVKPVSSAITDKVPRTVNSAALPAFPISRLEISVTVTRDGGSAIPFITRQIILENAIVAGCTENVAGGTTKIKLKGTRIGWAYVKRDNSWKISGISKSGWDTVTGTAWTNFQSTLRPF